MENIETLLQELLEDLLNRLATPFRRIRIEAKDDNNYRLNIESEEPSLLIGRHGENIAALQNIVKNISWKQFPGDYKITIDVDDYRKRQEENVIKMAERKAEFASRTQQAQTLPAMSPYFRRIIHLHLAKNFNDLVTESDGVGDFRHVIIKPKG